MTWEIYAASLPLAVAVVTSGALVIRSWIEYKIVKTRQETERLRREGDGARLEDLTDI